MKLFKAMTQIREHANPPGAGMAYASHVYHSALVLALEKLSDEQRAQLVEEVERIAVPIAEGVAA